MPWSQTICAVLMSMCLSGCNLFYAFVASAYQNQPTILRSHYPAAKSTTFKKHASGKLDFSTLQPASARLKQPTQISIAFASSGGGYRAAHLMLGAMMQMSQMASIRGNEDFLADVDYFSSVSGSGLAIGHYLSHYLDAKSHGKRFNFKQHIERMMRQDRRTGKPNMLRKDLDPFLFTGHVNGSFGIQKAFADLFTTGGHTLALGDVFKPKNAKSRPILPYWIVNTTIFQNMLAFPFIPSNLKNYAIIGYQDGPDHHIKPKHKNMQKFYAHIPMSLAQSASAAYPIALTPITLTSQACSPNCYLQLFDGGVADNLGIISAIKALTQDPKKIKILFILDASSAKDSPFSSKKLPPSLFSYIEKTPAMVTDGQSEQIRSNLRHFVHNFLCQTNTTNVIGIYLPLERYRSALNLNTSFNASLDEQKKLIHIGQNMIKENKTLQTLLLQIKQGRIKMGSCRTHDHLLTLHHHMPLTW